MRIEVVGAGSLGLLFAARLAHAGYRVKLVARTKEQRDKLEEAGVTVDGLTVLEKVRMDTADFSSTDEEERADWVFVTVKQPDLTSDFRNGLQRRIGDASRLLLFQNGVGHADKLSGLVSEDRLYVAVTTEGARRLSAVEVAHTGIGDTWLGVASGGELAGPAFENGKKLAETLAKAGFRSMLSKDIRSKVWEKLILNAVINPLTAVLGLRNGELLSTPERIRFMKRLYDEAAGLADRLGAGPFPDLWTRLLNVCRATAANHSSMLQDTLAGKPTELEAITGSLLKLANQIGMTLPTHQTLYELLLCHGSDSAEPSDLAE